MLQRIHSSLKSLSQQLSDVQTAITGSIASFPICSEQQLGDECMVIWREWSVFCAVYCIFQGKVGGTTAGCTFSGRRYLMLTMLISCLRTIGPIQQNLTISRFLLKLQYSATCINRLLQDSGDDKIKSSSLSSFDCMKCEK